MAEGVLVRLCRGALQPTVSGERLKREVIPILLALRRVAAYMAFKTDSATTGQIFKSFKSWHCHFPKGKALQGIDSGSEVSRGSIKESEEMAISSLSLLFDGSADSFLLKQLASDPNASAEALIQLPELAKQDFLKFEVIMGAWHSENPPADPPAASEVPATEAPATPAASVTSVTTPQKVAPEEMTEKPELVAEESEEPPGSRASELWPDLVLPTATADSLLTLPLQTQELILSQAQTRCLAIDICMVEGSLEV